MDSILRRLSAHAESRPDHHALIALRPRGEFEAVSFRQLWNGVTALCDELGPRLSQPAVVPILGSKSVDVVVAALAVLAAGSAFACLNRKLKPPQLNAVLRAARPPFAIFDSGAPALADVSESDAIAATPWVFVGPDRSDRAGSPAGDRPPIGHCDFRSRAGVPRFIEQSSDAPGCCLFTSGSTGTPKGVLVSVSDLDERARAEAELFRLSRDDVLLGVLPFSFDVGLNQLMASLYAGATLVLSESWLPSDLLRAVARFGVTGVSGVPAVWHDLLQSPLQFDRAGEHRSLRYVTVSGGDLPADRLTRLATAVDRAGIYKTYGQSETFRSTALRPDELNDRPESVGRAFGRARVYIVRPDGSQANADESGEIVHTGPGVMLGYIDGPSPCRQPNPFVGPDDPNTHAIFTGDVGHVDAAGYLFVHGRRDSMLKVAGNRIYPKEIVDQLLEIAGVADAEVIGQKTPGGDTEIIAFIATGFGGSLTPQALRHQLIRRLPSYMVPRHLRVIDRLPKTPNGKVDRPLLLASFEADRAATLLNRAPHELRF